MKNNCNPYTVPDNFFDDSCKEALSRYRKRIRTVRRCIAAMAVAAILIVIPVFMKQSQTRQVGENDAVMVSLANLYEYDIFLQVTFQ